uniref:Uncharacterized protein n=1 Tax=Sphaerodactylus townsendi TaxID=933632 RepID=A0ACB8FYB9_9SAUR
MDKALMLFLFVTFFGGCDAQVTMTQPPSMSASIGETVKIACRRSSGGISDYYNSWYQQKPGSAPILLIFEQSSRASGISDRFSGCDAQVTMTQPPSVSASIGETVRISCSRSSGGISGYYNSCYQQKPGSAPMLLIYTDDDRASGISDRFSGSLDKSANAAILTISNVQVHDEADYYCLTYYGSMQYTMIQPHGEVRQKPCCSRCALPWLCLAEAPVESPVTSLVSEMQKVMMTPKNLCLAVHHAEWMRNRVRV